MNIIIGSATHCSGFKLCFNAHPLIGYLVQCVCIDVCMCMDGCVLVCVGVGDVGRRGGGGGGGGGEREDSRYVVCVWVGL